MRCSSRTKFSALKITRAMIIPPTMTPAAEPAGIDLADPEGAGQLIDQPDRQDRENAERRQQQLGDCVGAGTEDLH